LPTQTHFVPDLRVWDIQDKLVTHCYK
jgi:hypothetical protein